MPFATSSFSGSKGYFYPGFWGGDQPLQGPINITNPKTYEMSSTFTASLPTIVLGPLNISTWNNLVVTMINDSSNNLSSRNCRIFSQ